jgi:hypothetical protein
MYFKYAQDYSLSALHHAIPPPWGSHLSLPPNKKAKQKIAVLQIITQNTSEKPGQENGKEKRNRNPLLHPSPYWSDAVVTSFSNLEDPEIGFG